MIKKIIDMLVSEKIDYFTWQRIDGYINECYLKEIKKSTLNDTPKI